MLPASTMPHCYSPILRLTHSSTPEHHPTLKCLSSFFFNVKKCTDLCSFSRYTSSSGEHAQCITVLLLHCEFLFQILFCAFTDLVFAMQVCIDAPRTTNRAPMFVSSGCMSPLLYVFYHVSCCGLLTLELLV